MSMAESSQRVSRKSSRTIKHAWKVVIRIQTKLHHNHFFHLNSSIVEKDSCLIVKKRKQQIIPQIPPSNFGLTSTSNGPGPQPILDSIWLRAQKINHSTLNWQTLCVGECRPDVCFYNIVAALKLHTETMKISPLSSSSGSTSKSYSEHKLLINDDKTSDSTSMKRFWSF